MKVPKGERPFWSLFGDIGITNFSYDFIYDNLSSPCVQASIEQWIGDWTCILEVQGSNLPSDNSFFLIFILYFSVNYLWSNIFFFHFFRLFTHFNTSYNTSSCSIHSFEFIKFRSAFASLCSVIYRPFCLDLTTFFLLCYKGC